MTDVLVRKWIDPKLTSGCLVQTRILSTPQFRTFRMRSLECKTLNWVFVMSIETHESGSSAKISFKICRIDQKRKIDFRGDPTYLDSCEIIQITAFPIVLYCSRTLCPYLKYWNDQNPLVDLLTITRSLPDVSIPNSSPWLRSLIFPKFKIWS